MLYMSVAISGPSMQVTLIPDLDWKLTLPYHSWERSSGISPFYYNLFPTVKPFQMHINRALNAGSDFKHMFK